MLKAGWDAHNLNAPGKFLVSAPGHDRPKRARAYLLTDQAVTETATHYSGYRPELDAESLRAVTDAANAHPGHDGNPDSESGSPGTGEPSGQWRCLKRPRKPHYVAYVTAAIALRLVAALSNVVDVLKARPLSRPAGNPRWPNNRSGWRWSWHPMRESESVTS